MDVAPSVDTVYHAVATLYGQDAVASGKASVWLGEFQNSLFAWEIADKLLAEKRDQTSCYFAAQTMRQKLLYSFHELPVNSHASLRDSLLQHLSDIPCYPLESNSVILTQLCLALVDLYLQVPSWTGFVGEILKKFGANADKTVLLLNLLRVFPEENQSRHLRLGHNRRQEVHAELAAQTGPVLQFLSDVCEMHASDQEVVKRALSCLSSWLLNPLVPTDELAHSRLMQSILHLLRDPHCPSTVHDAAADCAVAALYKTEDTKTHAALAASLQMGIYAMLESFNMCVAHDDFDKLQSYGRLFTELSESLLENIVDTPGHGLGDMRTLELLLTAVSYHDYTLAEMTFNVWYRLSELIYQRDDDKLNNIFRPYVERYIMALYKHCRFDSDHEGIPDENEEFNEFRRKTIETLKDVIFVVSTDSCVKSMFSILQAQGANSTWDETEAALFIITAVAKNLLPTEEEVVPLIVQAVLGLPTNTHPTLRYTAIRLLGELNEWLDANPSYQEGAVLWLLESMKMPALATVGADALEAVCGACKQKLAPQFDHILHAINALEGPDGRSQVSESAVIALLRALATILGGLPDDEIAKKMTDLCAKQAERLTQILHEQTASNNNNNNENDASRLSRDPAIWLDRLAAVFRHLAPSSDGPSAAKNENGKPKPWLPVVQHLWPVLSETCQRFENNVRVVEHCCRTVRFVIRSLGIQSFPFIEPLVKQMVDIYQRHPHSCFLYLGSILVDEYGSMADFVPGLLFMLQSFTEPSFKLLMPQNGLRDHPDTVDDLFRLCIRFVQRAPAAFFQSPSCQPLFECALAALSLDHQDANKSVTKFFIETIDSLLDARKKNINDPGVAAAEQILLTFGDRLVENSLQAALFHVHGNLVRDMAEILFFVGKLSKDKLSEWLKIALHNLPRNNGLCATDEQLLKFHNSVVGTSELRDVVAEVRDLIKLYR
uniref:Exportin-1/Importin-beta-like domain-containing protein n=1 Tax=Plectus sambesii TaxID=2011161 RepID=A0A914X9R9_9BILA